MSVTSGKQIDESDSAHHHPLPPFYSTGCNHCPCEPLTNSSPLSAHPNPNNGNLSLSLSLHSFTTSVHNPVAKLQPQFSLPTSICPKLSGTSSYSIEYIGHLISLNAFSFSPKLSLKFSPLVFLLHNNLACHVLNC